MLSRQGGAVPFTQPRCPDRTSHEGVVIVVTPSPVGQPMAAPYPPCRRPNRPRAFTTTSSRLRLLVQVQSRGGGAPSGAARKAAFEKSQVALMMQLDCIARPKGHIHISHKTCDTREIDI